MSVATQPEVTEKGSEPGLRIIDSEIEGSERPVQFPHFIGTEMEAQRGCDLHISRESLRWDLNPDLGDSKFRAFSAFFVPQPCQCSWFLPFLGSLSLPPASCSEVGPGGMNATPMMANAEYFHRALAQSACSG